MTNAFTLFGELKVETGGFKSDLRAAHTALEAFEGKLTGVEKTLQSVGDGIRSVGVAMSAAVTVPIVAAGTAAVASAVSFDTLRTQLMAATGSASSANAKFDELNKLAQANAGVLTKGAVATYAFLKPLGFMDGTINETIKAFGKLKSANPEVDLQRMATNLGQLFDQGFEQQDLKELLGNFPRAGEILQQAFGLSGSDRSTVAKEMKAAMAAGLSREDFFAAFAQGINNDQFLSKVTDPIAVKFEKMIERIQLALEPLGLVVLSVVERVAPPLTAFIERISAGFTSLSPTMQLAVTAFLAVVAAAGPFLVLAGGLVSTLGAMAGAIGAIVGSAGTLGVIAAVIAGLGVALVPIAGIAALFYNAWVSNWDLVKQVFNDGVAFISGVVNTGLAALATFWADHGAAIMGYVNAAYTTAATFIASVMDIISSALTLALQVIQGNWEGAWMTVLQITQQVWTAAVGLIAGALATVEKLILAAVPVLTQAFVWIGTQILTVVGKLIGNIVYFFATLPAQLVTLVPKMFTAAKDIGLAIWEGVKSGLSGGLLGNAPGGGSPSLDGPGSPFATLIESFKNAFGGAGPTAQLGGAVALGQTFLSPIKTEAIQTSKALDAVKDKMAQVKSAATSPSNAVAKAAAKVAPVISREQLRELERRAFAPILLDTGRIGTPTGFDALANRRASSASFDQTNEILAGLTKAVQEGKLEIAIIDPNSSTRVATSTPQTTKLRYNR